MAYYSIEKRLRADGTARYCCTVRVKKGGKYIYRENKTVWQTGSFLVLITLGFIPNHFIINLTF